VDEVFLENLSGIMEGKYDTPLAEGIDKAKELQELLIFNI
jgi:hypothetical protein